MNPFVVIGILGIGALALSLWKTAKAAVNLTYNIEKFRIYNISLKKIVFELVAKFANPQNTPLHIQMVNLTAYVDAQYTTTTANGKTVYNVQNVGLPLCTATDNKAFVIEPNGFTTHSFYPEISLLNILTGALSKVVEKIRTGSVDRPRNVLIKGFIKAEGVKIDVLTVIPLQS